MKFNEVKKAFFEALEVEPSERAAYLEALTAPRAWLLQQLRSG